MGTDVPGWATLAVSMMFFSGVQLLSIGILGEYVGRIFDEVKQRPVYLVAPRQRAERRALVDAVVSAARGRVLGVCADDVGLVDGVAETRRRAGGGRARERGLVRRRTSPAGALRRRCSASSRAPSSSACTSTSAKACRSAPLCARTGRRCPGSRACSRRPTCGRCRSRRSAPNSRRRSTPSPPRSAAAPDFVDGHQHVHALPGVRRIVLDAVATWPRRACGSQHRPRARPGRRLQALGDRSERRPRARARARRPRRRSQPRAARRLRLRRRLPPR